MGSIPDSVIVAVVMSIPTLLVYFGSRKKDKAEREHLDSDRWNEFTDKLERRIDQLNEVVSTQANRITQQDIVIAQQNDTLAKQNASISAQAARIAEQDRIIGEQQETIADLIKQIESQGQVPIHKKRVRSDG